MDIDAGAGEVEAVSTSASAAAGVIATRASTASPSGARSARVASTPASTVEARTPPSGPRRGVSRRLRIAFLVYRGNPRSGGQGVYTHHLTKALAELGHEVTVFAGQPYPVLDPRVAFVALPSLDLYRDEDPFRWPKLREIETSSDLLELATMRSGGFAEPRTFARRASAELARREGEFDLVHDDQCLGSAFLGLRRAGWPLIASIHHPISIDRAFDLEAAGHVGRRLVLRRWYGFARMQARVARSLDRIITVSDVAKSDIERDLGVDPARIAVVPVGVDTSIYRPHAELARVPGRIMVVSSADVALKGLVPLLEAVADLRRLDERVHLVVIGRPRESGPTRAAIDRLGLGAAVEFVADDTDDQVALRYASASVAVVPSLYEGFSLPAIEAMACAVPLVATTGGALPEVVGGQGVAALLVPPGSPSELAAALRAVLGDQALATALGQAGRARVLDRYTWKMCAEGTVEQYLGLLGDRSC